MERNKRNKTFQRVFRGQTFDETKAIVRKKLGLANDASVQLSQLYGGNTIELEDDDDFDAFSALARSASSIEVSVNVEQLKPSYVPHRSQESSPAAGPSRIREESRNSVPDASFTTTEASGPVVPSTSKKSATAVAPPISNTHDIVDGSVHHTLRASSSTLDADGEPRKKRKKKNTRDDAQSQALTDPTVRNLQKLHADRSHPASLSSPKLQKGSSKKRNNAITDAQEPAARAGDKRKRPLTPPPSLPDDEGHAGSVQVSVDSSPVKKKRKKEKQATSEVSAVHAASISRSVVEGLSLAGKGKHPSKSKDSSLNSVQQDLLPPVETAGAEDAGDLLASKEKKAKKAKQTQELVKTATSIQNPAAVTKALRDSPAKSEEASVSPAVVESTTTKSTGEIKDKKKSKKSLPADVNDTKTSAEKITPANQSAATEPASIPKEKKNRKSSQSNSTKKKKSDAGARDHATAAASEKNGEPIMPSKEKKRGKMSGSTENSSNVETAEEIVETPLTQPKDNGKDKKSSLAKSKPKLNGKKAVDKSTNDETSGDKAQEESAGAQEPSQAEALRSVFRTVLARTSPSSSLSASSGSAQPRGQEAAIVVESKPIAKKAKAGRSKLSMSWSPQDMPSAGPSTDSTSVTPSPPIPEPTSMARKSEHTAAAVKEKASVRGKKVLQSDAVACPVCQTSPFHLRFQCPVVLAGADSIRHRIKELKGPEHDVELVHELEDLLKKAMWKTELEAQRSSPRTDPEITSTAPPRLNDALPLSTPPLPPASAPADLPPSSLTRALRRHSIPPLIPAGSEISEVVVESKDEGSSNDSSSSDEESDIEDNGLATLDHAKAELAGTDLEALLRGPVKPRTSILSQIPSQSSSEEEDEEDVESDEDEDDKDDTAFRRISRKFTRAGSSSDEEMAAGAVSEEDEIVSPTFMDVDSNEVIDHQGESGRQTSVPKDDVRIEDVMSVDEVHLTSSLQEAGPDSKDTQVSKHIEAPEATKDTHVITEADSASQPVPTAPEDPSTITENPGDLTIPDAQEAAPSIIEASDPVVPVPVPVEEIHQSESDDDDHDEDVAESIEIADELLPTTQSVQENDDADSIELNLTECQSTRERSTPPPLSTKSPGTVKRMKDRHGRLSQAIDRLSSLPSSLLDAKQSTPVKGRKAQPPGETPNPSQAESVEGTVAKRTRMSMRRSASVAAMLPPPPPPVAAAVPKRRTRLTAEERAKRDAEREAEKERKAAERKAKAAEKKAQAAERAAAKKAEKEEKARARKEATQSKKAGGQVPLKDASSSGLQVAPPETPRPSAHPGSQPAAWATLAQTPSYVEAESLNIDELRSSSPSSNLLRPELIGAEDTAEDGGNETINIDELRSSSRPELLAAEDAAKDGGDETITQDRDDIAADAGMKLTESLPRIDDYSNPLFLPSSQVVETRHLELDSTPKANGKAESSSSDSDSDEEESETLVKQPLRPRTWVINAPFRRLSDIASQQLFSPIAQTTFRSTQNLGSVSGIAAEDDDDDEDEDEDESDGSSSDSDVVKSHIPRDRRAGAGVQKKRRNLDFSHLHDLFARIVGCMLVTYHTPRKILVDSTESHRIYSTRSITWRMRSSLVLSMLSHDGNGGLLQHGRYPHRGR
ncbi:hypothetical protein A0H81_11813 [Grifola frondosa]|uniref:Uncharacterized protein n=1 Tax=Grifola frondosa TaxID=5627 RepID=A0A1C7LUB5_GRIFR|nr:hypothetical protein A0H81_11813 [Grifola frondosa]